jgi:hypothetical protein
MVYAAATLAAEPTLGPAAQVRLLACALLAGAARGDENGNPACTAAFAAGIKANTATPIGSAMKPGLGCNVCLHYKCNWCQGTPTTSYCSATASCTAGKTLIQPLQGKHTIAQSYHSADAKCPATTATCGKKNGNPSAASGSTFAITAWNPSGGAAPVTCPAGFTYDATKASTPCKITYTTGTNTWTKCDAAGADKATCCKSAAPVKVDCVGAWSTCAANCQKTYTVSKAAANGGAACPAATGAKLPCTGGACIPPTLPALPTQFEAVVEANIVNKNYTIHMHEWFDKKNNRARTDMYSYTRHQSSTNIYDFGKNHYFHLDSQAGCQWGDTAHITGRSFGVEQSGGSGPHLSTSERYFRFGAGMNETYVGRKTVRNIMADHWIATMSRGGNRSSTMTLDYYFSVPEWKLPDTGSTRVPLRLKLTGTRLVTSATDRACVAKCNPPGRACWTKCSKPLPKGQWYNHTYDHVYDYTSFKVGAPKASVFDQPCGIACKSTNKTWNPMTLPAIGCPGQCNAAAGGRGVRGRGGDHSASQSRRNYTRSKPPPSPPAGTAPKLATEYSASIEVTVLATPSYLADKWPLKTTVNMHEWVSSSQDRARVDVYTVDKKQTSSSMYDFKQNLYEHHTNDGANCLWGDIRHIAGDDGMSQWLTADGTGKPHLATTQKLFIFGGTTKSGKNITEKYLGSASVRGITTDHWTSGEITDTYVEGTTTMHYTMKTDHYFASPAWSSPEAHGTQIPIRTRIRGTTKNMTSGLASGDYHQVIDYTSFHVGTPHADVFAIPCGAVCNSTNTTWNSAKKQGPACITTKCPPPPAPPAPKAVVGSVTGSLTLTKTLAEIQVGTVERALFEAAFTADVAKAIGCAPELVVIMSIASGSVVVNFAVLPVAGKSLAASAITSAFAKPGVVITGVKTTKAITAADVKIVAPPPSPPTTPGPAPPTTPGPAPPTTPGPAPPTTPVPAPATPVAAPTGSGAGVTVASMTTALLLVASTLVL